MLGKKAVVEEIITKLEVRLKMLETSIASLRKSAMNAHASIESWSDTTKYQSSQLASNLEERYSQLEKCIKSFKNIDVSKTYKKVEIGALVKVQKTKEIIYYFISPGGSGGDTFKIDKYEIMTLSVDSPLAQAILGKKAGESAKFEIPPESQTIFIQKIT